MGRIYLFPSKDVHMDMGKTSCGLGQVVGRWLGVAMDLAMLALLAAPYQVSEISFHGVPHKLLRNKLGGAVDEWVSQSMDDVEDVPLECGRDEGAGAAGADVTEDRRISGGDFHQVKVGNGHDVGHGLGISYCR